MGNRYYLMEMLDAWTNVFASPGTRTTGNGKGDFAITGPSWKGQLPEGVKEIKSPTNMVWLIGRTQTNGRRLCGGSFHSEAVCADAVECLGQELQGAGQCTCRKRSRYEDLHPSSK